MKRYIIIFTTITEGVIVTILLLASLSFLFDDRWNVYNKYLVYFSVGKCPLVIQVTTWSTCRFSAH